MNKTNDEIIEDIFSSIEIKYGKPLRSKL